VLLVLLLLGWVRPHASDLSRWIAGSEPAYNSPRVAAAVRDSGGSIGARRFADRVNAA